MYFHVLATVSRSVLEVIGTGRSHIITSAGISRYSVRGGLPLLCIMQHAVGMTVLVRVYALSRGPEPDLHSLVARPASLCSGGPG